MLVSALSSLLLAASLSRGAPVTLDPAATAEAQQRDNTATRAFSAVAIKDNTGKCLFVDPLSGDFRENLTPVQTANCDGSKAQQWDVITKGKHNDRAGFALFVSTLTNACLNFDPRRAAGNQVLLFSCGGRADGGGQVTDSQLFAFNGSSGPLALVPANGNNATCIDSVNGKLDQTGCNPAKPAANQLFTIGNGGAAAQAPPATTAAATTSKPAASAPPATAPSNPKVTTGTKLDQAAVAEAQQRDNTATRAFTAVPIKTSDGLCLFVDPTSGDFRENLTPVQAVKCDGSAGQQWDVITSGKHNNQAGFALIVSSLTNACLNFDPRRAAGNQVLLFSCGGRADGGGQVTDSQLFAFSGKTGPQALVPQNGKNAVCLTINSGLVDQTACNPAQASGQELFTIGNGAAAPAAATQPAATAASSTKPAAAATSAPATAAAPSNPKVTTGTTLNQAAVAEAQQRDNTATRALSGVPIKTSNGLCLFVDPTSGDFRENLTPVQAVKCDANSAGQKWDVITSGKHNNQAGFALIVSTLTNACLNFDPHRAAGNQVLLFSCGGRADGGGQVTDSQLFAFSGKTGPQALVPQNGKNQVCLTINNGLVDQTSCNPAQASGLELFTL